MAFPLLQLPVVQNWDCHTAGSCCKEYLVTITEDEKKRIEAQGWDAARDLDGYQPFWTVGPFWARLTLLNSRPDGSCVFLSEQGRCRIHERHGYDTKPLPCRLFPFVLVPQGDRWGVSLRFACPSAAANKGRPVAAHDDSLRQFAAELAVRAGLKPQPDGKLNAPPQLVGGWRVNWDDLRRYTAALLDILKNGRDSLERRMRKCLALASQCRQAPKIHEVSGHALSELLGIFSNFAESETPSNPAAVPSPSWIGRLLFRQLLAVYSRKDHGPNRGLAGQGRVALLGAALRFARGKGSVPRMHHWLPETTFEKVEAASGKLDPVAEEVLERYYAIKVSSLQFCGTTSFGMSFWEGFEALALTLPVIVWTARAFAPQPIGDGVTKALSIVDDHFGFNKVLGTLRQRFAMRLLASRGETVRLIARYSR